MDFLTLSPWTIGILATSVIGLIAIVLLVRFIRREPVLLGALKNIRSELLLVWYWLYPIRWRMRMALRNVFVQSALFFLMMTSLYVLIELTFSLAEHIDALRSLAKQLHFRPLPELPTLPPSAEVVLLGLGVLMAIRRIREWRLRKREDKLSPAVSSLLKQLANLRGSTAAADPAATRLFITTSCGGLKRYWRPVSAERSSSR